jgi:hypothetical protein
VRALIGLHDPKRLIVGAHDLVTHDGNVGRNHHVTCEQRVGHRVR